VDRANWCLSDVASPCVASKLSGCQDLGAAQMLAQYTVDCVGDAAALRPETKTLQRCGGCVLASVACLLCATALATQLLNQ
jgi:hypothetical protein